MILQLTPLLDGLAAARQAASNAVRPDDEVSVDDRGDHWIFTFVPRGEALGGGARVSIAKEGFTVLRLVLEQ